MPNPAALNQQLVAPVTVICDFECPDAPPETDVTFALTYRNGEGTSFLSGAIVHAAAQLLVTYQAEGAPSEVVAADLLRPQPGGPQDTDYVDHAAPMTNMTGVSRKKSLRYRVMHLTAGYSPYPCTLTNNRQETPLWISKSIVPFGQQLLAEHATTTS